LYETYGFKPLQGLAVFVWEKQQVIRR